MIKIITVKPKTPLRPKKVDLPLRVPVTIRERIVAIKQQIEYGAHGLDNKSRFCYNYSIS